MVLYASDSLLSRMLMLCTVVPSGCRVNKRSHHGTDEIAMENPARKLLLLDFCEVLHVRQALRAQ